MARPAMKVEAFQSVEEMAAQMQANGRNKLYPEVAADVKKQSLADVVNQQRELMKMTKQRGRKIDLDDLDEVEACVEAYLEACVRSNCIPSMLNFAAASGWSRKHIYKYINTHNTPSALYLDNLRSSWASIMAQLALTRQASEATAIFLLKNSGQDLTDRCEITAIPMAPEREELTPEEIAARYLDALPAPDETHRKDDGE